MYVVKKTYNVPSWLLTIRQWPHGKSCLCTYKYIYTYKFFYRLPTSKRVKNNHQRRVAQNNFCVNKWETP